MIISYTPPSWIFSRVFTQGHPKITSQDLYLRILSNVPYMTFSRGTYDSYNDLIVVGSKYQLNYQKTPIKICYSTPYSTYLDSILSAIITFSIVQELSKTPELFEEVFLHLTRRRSSRKAHQYGRYWQDLITQLPPLHQNLFFQSILSFFHL